MIITRNRPKVVKFLGSSTKIIDGSDEQLEDLEFSKVEESLELFQITSKFMEIESDSPKEVKNQVLRDHAIYIVEHIHCQTEEPKKKRVRFQEEETDISSLKKISSTLPNIAENLFQYEVSRLSNKLRNHAPPPMHMMRQSSAGPAVSCGIDHNMSYGDEEYERFSNNFAHR